MKNWEILKMRREESDFFILELSVLFNEIMEFTSKGNKKDVLFGDIEWFFIRGNEMCKFDKKTPLKLFEEIGRKIDEQRP